MKNKYFLKDPYIRERQGQGSLYRFSVHLNITINPQSFLQYSQRLQNCMTELQALHFPSSSVLLNLKSTVKIPTNIDTTDNRNKPILFHWVGFDEN